jgi:poly-beta-hydroxyalkanoate depolymerase
LYINEAHFYVKTVIIINLYYDIWSGDNGLLKCCIQFASMKYYDNAFRLLSISTFRYKKPQFICAKSFLNQVQQKLKSLQRIEFPFVRLKKLRPHTKNIIKRVLSNLSAIKSCLF